MRSCICFFICILSLQTWSQDQQVSSGILFNGEPYFAQDPDNPHHMVVAWMGTEIINLQAKITIHTRVTFDAGLSWSPITLIGHVLPEFGSADPSVEFDAAGNAFLTYIDYSPEIEEGGIYVRRSSDGGLTWQDPVLALDMHADGVQYPVDRPWMVIDLTSGAGSGNIYITSTNPRTFGDVQPPYHPYFVRSTDGGESFSPWSYLDSEDWLAGDEIGQPMAAPAVGPDGRFHAIYPSYVSTQNVLPQFIHAWSTDQGDSFQYQQVYDGLPGESDPFAKKGYRMQADPSDPEHLIFLNFENTEGDLDLVFRESFDGGGTWTEGQRVNDDPSGNGALQDLVWSDFDDDGDLAITWRDRRNSGEDGYSTSTEIWGVTRSAGSGFGSNFQVSSGAAPHSDILLEAGNDFMCVKLHNDTLYAVWGDTRSSVLHIWFQRMTMGGDVVSLHEISGEDPVGFRLFPNPAADVLFVEGRGILQCDVVCPDGRVVHTQVESGTWRAEVSVNLLVPGTYFMRIVHELGTSMVPFQR